jgi:hypothetical protein
MFSTVFLCVKEPKHNKFTCKEFKSFLEADKYFKDNHKDKMLVSTMIPWSAKCKPPLGLYFGI